MTLGTIAVCTLAAVLWIRRVERNRLVKVGDVATEQVGAGELPAPSVVGRSPVPGW